MNEITRWIVINTVGYGHTQKFCPHVTFFRDALSAHKFLLSKIKEHLDKEEELYERYGGHRPLQSIKQFLENNCITQFETNDGLFFLERVRFD